MHKLSENPMPLKKKIKKQSKLSALSQKGLHLPQHETTFKDYSRISKIPRHEIKKKTKKKKPQTKSKLEKGIFFR